MTAATTVLPTSTAALDRDTVRAFLAGKVGPDALPEPAWGPIGKEVYERTYSRKIDTPDGPRGEVWAETVRRVVLGNLGYAPAEVALPDEAAELFELIYTFKATPAGRHLWVTGTTSPYSRNCWISAWSERTSDHVKFLGSRLFEGGGVGANYSADLIAATTPIYGRVDVAITCREGHPDFDAIREAAGDSWLEDVDRERTSALMDEVWRVDDSREGWVATWIRMIDLACHTRETMMSIDVSDIRPYGAPLKTFGGTASGPAPLVTAVRAIADILTGARGRRLTGLEAMQIDHEIAASVVAGGTRRSARMSMMNWADPQIFDFINCKQNHEAHWTTNISVEIDAAFRDALARNDSHARMVLQAVAKGMTATGEPGFIDSDAHSVGEPVRIRATNPCLTGDTMMLTRDGLKPIAELAGVSFEVWNGVRWSRSTAWSTGVKPAYEVRLSDGRTITATGNHVFATADGREVSVEHLLGEKIAFFGGTGWDGGSDPYTTDEALLLGFLQGDGTKRADCGAISTNNNEPEVAAMLQSFGFHRQGDVWYAGAKSAAASLVAKAEMLDEHVNHRRLPEWLMTASAPTVLSFLRGLYSANGTALTTTRRVTLKTTCRELAGGVQKLLGAFGIRSYITTNEPSEIQWQNGTYTSQESYDLNVGAYEHIRRFEKLVGFLHAHKTAALAAYQQPKHTYLRAAEVVSVTPVGEVEVFDFNEPQRHWGWANGMQAHNCGEASLSSEGAWGESCNLGSVNLAAFGTDLTSAHRAFRLMARFLYRATLNPYPGEDAQRIEARNRRIGVGIMGLQGWLAENGMRLTDLAGSDEMKRELTGFRLTARMAADHIAHELGLPRSVKVTAVAPTGTIAQLSGTTPGIHPVFARHYLRRVRYADSDSHLSELAAKGYTIVDDVYADNTKVVEFPQRDALAARFGARLIEQSDELSFGQFMDLVAAVQNTFCGGTDGQAVSATAQIPEGSDPVSLAFDIERLLGSVKGVTAFPDASGRMLAPYERITEEQFNEATAKLFYADLAAMTGDSNDGLCLGGSCPVR